MTPTDVLKHHAHQLQMAAPKEWDAFVECFDAYATEVTVAVTHAPQTEVLQMQGQARAFLHLLTSFRECHIQKKPPPAQTQQAPSA